MKKRSKLAEARYSMGWSQEEAAEYVGVTRTTFSQWERGICDPYPIHVHRLCEIFETTVEELDLVKTQGEIISQEGLEAENQPLELFSHAELSHADESATMLHRLSQTIAQGIVQAFTEAGIQDLNSLLYQLGKQNMDEKRRILFQIVGASASALMGLNLNPQLSVSALLQDWEYTAFFKEQLAALWDIYHTGGTILADHQLKLLVATYERNVVHQQASEALCMSYQLQGSLYRDMMKFDDAHTFYQKAFEVARELDDAELTAAALARRGVACIQQNMAKAAIEYLNEAQRLMKDRSFPYLSGYIFQAFSEAYAIVQQTYESEHALEMAQQALMTCGRYPERSHCEANTTSVTAQKGVNAVHLHDYSAAITLIEQGMKKYNPTFVRGRARLKAQQSEAYYGHGDIDACCQSATEAWVLAKAATSNRTFARLRKLQLDLIASPWKKEASVIDLNWVMTTL